MTAAGRPPAAIVAFGCPRPGYHQLADLLAAVPLRSYRNGNAGNHDYVTDLPFTLPAFPFVEPRPFIDICAPPPANDRWGLLAYHHIELYEQALVSEA
jgi:hypothetical protein